VSLTHQSVLCLNRGSLPMFKHKIELRVKDTSAAPGCFYGPLHLLNSGIM
jgi:hypothetical protein